MKKNGFLTFIFACIPGAGQMYYGYAARSVADYDVYRLLYSGSHY